MLEGQGARAVRILVVDDHSECRRVAVHLLATLGYEAIAAGNASEAEQIFRQDPTRIEVVMLDLFLGATAGVALARRLESQRTGLRVLFMSGYDREEMCAAPDLLGPTRHFIGKPFSLAALGAAITALLAGATGDPGQGGGDRRAG